MGVLALILCFGMIVPSMRAQAATTIYNEQTGQEDGYDYALWKDYGDTSMTLNGGGTFSCWWDNIGNALFRKGKTFDCTKTYSQIGNISIDYGCYYQPSIDGNTTFKQYWSVRTSKRTSGSSGSSSSGSSSSGSTWNGTTIQCEAFYYGGSYPAVYTIKNVSHGTGNQEVKLVVTTDDGTWDGYIDYLQISLEKTCLYEKNMLIY